MPNGVSHWTSHACAWARVGWKSKRVALVRRASLAPVAILERVLDFGRNQGQGSRERGLYTQIGGIEQVGVGGLFQGGNRPGFVGGVPGVELGQKAGLVPHDPHAL